MFVCISPLCHIGATDSAPPPNLPPIDCHLNATVSELIMSEPDIVVLINTIRHTHLQMSVVIHLAVDGHQEAVGTNPRQAFFYHAHCRVHIKVVIGIGELNHLVVAQERELHWQPMD